ncbi:Spc98 family-domain-containing protein [Dipodascopsis tothii]|uniref:Spc98 family-domain-containing protein n=1 Tax=Dipodascopsis tothii TaxID=44089 RepID=UPI0034CED629
MSVRPPNAADRPEKTAGDRADRADRAASGRAASERLSSDAAAAAGRGLPVDAVWVAEVKLAQTSISALAPRIEPAPLSYNYTNLRRPPSLEPHGPDAQAAVIMEDVLFVLLGCEGQYIMFHEQYNPAIERERLQGPQYRLAKGLDPSLRDLVRRLLKTATHFSAVEAFVELQSKTQHGVVNHALCAAMRTVVAEYTALVADLELKMLTQPSFTLHTLQVELMEPAQKLAHMYALVQKLAAAEPAAADDDLGTDFDKIMETLKANDGDFNALAGLGGGRNGPRTVTGGNVLRVLTDQLNRLSGAPLAKQLLTFLLHEASRPYVKMVNDWLHHGLIADPYGEFMIKEQKSIRREQLDQDYIDEYWEKRYTVRKDDLPAQLADAAIYDKVLLAGKFLNVVRECGGPDVVVAVADVPQTIDDPRLLASIDRAYAHANQSLLGLLIESHKLSARLTALKHYFFLDQSDFFTHFMDVAWHELRKPIGAVSVSKLQSLLDLILRQPGSMTAGDPFKDDVSVHLNEVGLTDWLMRIVSVSGVDPTEAALSAQGMKDALGQQTRSDAADDKKAITGIQALQLDFAIPFPLSLVVSRKTMLRYQLLFRHLVSLKYIEQLLGHAWLEHAKAVGWTHRSRDKRLQRWKAKTWNLRSKMLVFIQHVLYFSTTEVLESNWNTLMSGIKDVRTVNDLMQNHVDFLDTCLKECMLTNSKLLRIMAKLMTACRLFATYSVQLSKTLLTLDADLAGENASVDGDRMTKLETNLGQYEQSFDYHLHVLMEALNYYAATETVVLLSLCARLEVCMAGEPPGIVR